MSKKIEELKTSSCFTPSSLVPLEKRIMLDAAAPAALTEATQETQNNENNQQNDKQSMGDPYEGKRKDLIFIDENMDEHKGLLEDLFKDVEDELREDADYHVINLEDRVIFMYNVDDSKDGIGYLTEVISNHENIDGLYILSKTMDDSIQLGSSKLNEISIYDNESKFQSWQSHFSKNADILIYGFHDGDNGNQIDFAQELHVLTGADVSLYNFDLSKNFNGEFDLKYDSDKDHDKNYIFKDYFYKQSYDYKAKHGNYEPIYKVFKNDYDTSSEPGDDIEYKIFIKNIGYKTGKNILVQDMFPDELFENVQASHGGIIQDGQITWNFHDLDPHESVVLTVTAKLIDTVPAGIDEFTNKVWVRDDARHSASKFVDFRSYGWKPTGHTNEFTKTVHDVDIVIKSHGGKIIHDHKDGYGVSGGTIHDQIDNHEKITVEFFKDGMPIDVRLNKIFLTDLYKENHYFKEKGKITYEKTNGDSHTDHFQADYWKKPYNSNGEKTLYPEKMATKLTFMANGKGSDFSILGFKFASNSAHDDDTNRLDAAPGYAVTKTNNLEEVEPGQIFTYTIEVSNVNNQDGTGVFAKDTFNPDHFEILSASDGGAIDQAGGMIFWTLGNLDAGDSKTLTVEVKVKDPLPNGTKHVKNTVEVGDDGQNGEDPDLSNNIAMDKDKVKGGSPKYEIMKDDYQDKVVPGQEYTYDIKLTNTGNHKGTGIVIEDMYPLDVFETITPGQGGVDNGNGTITWNIPELGAGETITVTVTVKIKDTVQSGLDKITNMVWMHDDMNNSEALCLKFTDDEFDPGDDENTFVKMIGDIKMTIKSINGDLHWDSTDGYGVTGGDDGDELDNSMKGKERIHVTFTKDGMPINVKIAQIDFTDFFNENGYLEKAKVVFNQANGTTSSMTYTADPSQMQNNSNGEKSVHPNLKASKLVFKVPKSDKDYDYSIGGIKIIDNSAHDKDVNWLEAVPGYEITKDDGIEHIAPGETTTYNITVTNVGNQDGDEIVVTDTFDENQLEFVSTNRPDLIDLTQVNDGIITWNIPTLAAQDSIVLTLEMKVKDEVHDTDDTIIKNTVTVEDNGENGEDPTPENNMDMDTNIIERCKCEFPQDGVFQLFNHPDGNAANPLYGLRLDELEDVTNGHDIFTFDFEADGAAMFLELDQDANTIRIYGTAFGGLDIGNQYDPNNSALYEIDFTYQNVFPAVSGDADNDDLQVFSQNPGQNGFGYIKNLDTEESYDLFEKANNSGLAFQLGDKNGQGHRGFDGVSGWGWLNHTVQNVHVGASDWLFTLDCTDDLQVVKTNDLTELEPGQEFDYTITVTNNGTGKGEDVIVTDHFPFELLDFIDSDPAVLEINEQDGTITWDLGDLKPGKSEDITLTVKVKDKIPAGVNKILNKVTVEDADGVDPTPEDNMDTDEDILKAEPKYRLIKDDFQDEAEPGDTFTYTIKLFNDGNQDGTGIVISDMFPVDLFASVTPSDGGVVDYQHGTITWEFDTLAACDCIELSVEVTLVDSVESGIEEFTNMVWMRDDMNNSDPICLKFTDDEFDPGDDEDTFVKMIGDIKMTIKAINGDLHWDSTDGYGVTGGDDGDEIDNHMGTKERLHVTFTKDGMPIDVKISQIDFSDFFNENGYLEKAKVKFVQADGTSTSVTYEADASQVPGSTNGESSENPNLFASELIFKVPNSTKDYDYSLAGIKIIENTAHAEDTNTLKAAPGYAVTKDDGLLVVKPGETQQVVYTITVSNVGNQDGENITATDNFDPNLLKNVQASDGGIVNQMTGEIIWNFPALAVGETLEFTVSGDLVDKVDAGVETLVNTVFANDDGSNGPDPDLSNNMATDIDIVDANPIYEVTKDDFVEAAEPGDELTYEIKVSNTGNQGGTGIVVTDHFPVGLFASVEVNENGVVDMEAGTITWTFPELPACEEICLEVKVVLAEKVDAGIENFTNCVWVRDDGENTETEFLDFRDEFWEPGATDTVNRDIGNGVEVEITSEPRDFYHDNQDGYGVLGGENDEVDNRNGAESITYAFKDTDKDMHIDMNLEAIRFSDLFDGETAIVTFEAKDGTITEIIVNGEDVPNGEVTVELPADLAASKVTFTAQANSSFSILGFDIVNNSAHADDTNILDAAPEYEVTKDDFVEVAEPGDELTYEIKVENTGNQGGTNIIVTDHFPVGLFAEIEVNEGGVIDYENGKITWTFDELPACETICLEVKVVLAEKVDAGIDDFTNCVWVKDDGENTEAEFLDFRDEFWEPDNGDDKVKRNIGNGVQLKITSAPRDFYHDNQDGYGVLGGNQNDEIDNQNGEESITYSFKDKSKGELIGMNLEAIRFSDLFDGETAKVTVESPDGSITEFLVDGEDVPNGEVTFELPANLHATKVTFTAVGGSSYSILGFDIVNNSAHADDTNILKAEPKYEISKDDYQEEVRPGDEYTYKILLQNTGNQAGTGIVVQDHFPTDILEILEISPEGQIDVENGKITWNFDELPACEEICIEVKVKVKDKIDENIEEFTNSVWMNDDMNNSDPLCFKFTDPEFDAQGADEIVIPLESGVEMVIKSSPRGLYWDDVDGLGILGGDDNDEIDLADMETMEIHFRHDGMPIEVKVSELNFTDLYNENGFLERAMVTFIKANGDETNMTYEADPGQTLGNSNGELTVNPNLYATKLVLKVPEADLDYDFSVGGIKIIENTAHDTDTNVLIAAPQYELTKDDYQEVAKPGDEFTYKIKLTNNGNQTGTGIVITDMFPVGLFETVTASDGGIVDMEHGTITWEFDSLEACECLELSVDVKIKDTVAAGIDEFTNMVWMRDDMNNSDPICLKFTDDEFDPGNNEDTFVQMIDDIKMTIRAINGDLHWDSTDGYGVTGGDDGDELDNHMGTKERIIVEFTKDGMPIDVKVSQIDFSDFFNENGYLEKAKVKFIQADGTSTSVTYEADASQVPGSTNGESSENPNLFASKLVFKVPNSTKDYDYSIAGIKIINNTAHAEDTNILDAEPDYSITKDDGVLIVTPGETDQVTYLIKVRNDGDQDGTNIIIKDIYDSNLLENITASNGGVVDENTGMITWNFDDLAAGDEITVSVTGDLVESVASGVEELKNTVSVTDDGENGEDPTPENNTAMDIDIVDANPIFEVTKDDGLDSVEAGQEYTYTIKVRNVGNQDATDVLVSDMYPPELLDIIETSPMGTVDAINGTITWNLDDLFVDDDQNTNEITFEVKVKVKDTVPAGFDFVENMVWVRDDGSDTEPEFIDFRDQFWDPGNNVNQVIRDIGNGVEVTVTSEPRDFFHDNNDGYGVLGGNQNDEIDNQNGQESITYEFKHDGSDIDLIFKGVKFSDMFDGEQGKVIFEATDGTITEFIVDGQDVPNGETVFDLPMNIAATKVTFVSEGNSSFSILGLCLVNNSAHAEDIDILDAVPGYTLTKDDGNTQVVPGQELTYTITIENVATQDGTGVTIEDIIDTDLLENIQISDGGQLDGNKITWDIGDLAAGDTFTVTVTANVVEKIGAGIDTLINEAIVFDDGENGEDPTPENNFDDDINEIVAAPEYEVTKDDYQESAEPGDEFTYEIKVSNVGNQEGKGIVVKDHFPVGLFTSVEASHGGVVDMEAGTIMWMFDSLPACEELCLEVDVVLAEKVDAGIDEFTNEVWVRDDGENTGAEFLDFRDEFWEPGDGDDKVVRDIGNGVKLKITSEPRDFYHDNTDGYGVLGGENDEIDNRSGAESITYKFKTADDNKKIDMNFERIRFSDLFEGETAKVTLKSTDGTETVILVNGEDVPNGETILDLPDDLAVWKVTFEAEGNSSFSILGFDIVNNSVHAEDTNTLVAQPDYEITKDDFQEVVKPGDTFTYKILVENKGNQDGTGVVITDTIPLEVLEVLDISDGGMINNDVITWNIGDLEAGDIGQVTITAKVKDTVPAGFDDFTNIVTIDDNGENGEDPTPENNTDTDTDILNANPDYSIEKDDGLLIVTPGVTDTVTYTLVIKNNGNQDGTGVVVTDTYDNDLLMNMIASDGGMINEMTGEVTWNIGDLGAGETIEVTLTGELVDTVGVGVEELVNIAMVTDDGENGEDPTPENNIDDDIDIVNAVPGYKLNKDDGLTVVEAGQQVTYTITVENVANQDGSNVVITDTYDTSLYTNVTAGQGGVVDAENGIVTWHFSELKAGDTLQVTLTGDIVFPIPVGVTQVENIASVTDDGENGEDPTPENNIDNDIDQINAAPGFAIEKENGLNILRLGEEITYDVVVESGQFSTQNATGVTVVDNFDQNLIITQDHIDDIMIFKNGDDITEDGIVDITFDEENRTITFFINGIYEVGDQYVFKIPATVTNNPVGNTTTNRVEVFDDGENGEDPNLADNVADDTDLIIPRTHIDDYYDESRRVGATYNYDKPYFHNRIITLYNITEMDSNLVGGTSEEDYDRSFGGYWNNNYYPNPETETDHQYRSELEKNKEMKDNYSNWGATQEDPYSIDFHNDYGLSKSFEKLTEGEKADGQHKHNDEDQEGFTPKDKDEGDEYTSEVKDKYKNLNQQVNRLTVAMQAKAEPLLESLRKISRDKE